jgi:hypothetical protein
VAAKHHEVIIGYDPRTEMNLLWKLVKYSSMNEQKGLEVFRDSISDAGLEPFKTTFTPSGPASYQ